MIEPTDGSASILSQGPFLVLPFFLSRFLYLQLVVENVAEEEMLPLVHSNVVQIVVLRDYGKMALRVQSRRKTGRLRRMVEGRLVNLVY